MATAESKPLANDLLFFGCRSPGKDDFFPDEWVALCDRAGLRRHVAYSRADAAPRQYVQHLLHEQAVAVREALVTKQGHFILCGSSGNMPKGVRAALLDVLAAGFAEQGGDADIESEGRAMTAAEQYLAGMEKAGRYKQETW
jgi:sulfite reductase alpha subunit-like flavoprotein